MSASSALLLALLAGLDLPDTDRATVRARGEITSIRRESDAPDEHFIFTFKTVVELARGHVPDADLAVGVA